MKKALIELVRISSVCDEDRGGYPFGEAIDQALRKALQVAGDLGFKTQYGYAEIGQGKGMMGFKGHLDVLPPGKLDDWHLVPSARARHAAGCFTFIEYEPQVGQACSLTIFENTNFGGLETRLTKLTQVVNRSVHQLGYYFKG